MWGYQLYYRVSVEYRMNNVLKELGVPKAGAECFLVGARAPGNQNPNEVCIEPEDGKWSLNLFNDLLATVEVEVKAHPLQNMYYGDEPSMRDKPENIRRDSVRRAVQKALSMYDQEHDARSFAGAPVPVGGYYVVPVLQLPHRLFEQFRPLREPVTDGQLTGNPSLIHATIAEVLSEAHDELFRPDPGRDLSRRSRSSEEIVRRAAASFMRTPGLAMGDRNYDSPDLFERFNLISSLMYEGVEGTGRMLLAKPDSGAVDVLLQLAEPVPFREPRWSRKVLQMASSKIALIADCEKVLGLGNIADGVDPWVTQNIFEIEFLDHYHWHLSCGDEVLLVSRYGAPSLPQERFPRARLVDTYRRLFRETTDEDVETFTELFDTAVAQHHGSMLVVAQDAETEAERLRGQGTRVDPMRLTPELYQRVSGIDGTIIVDPHCVCHAIGVILDGPARSECTPSRGSRYNSGIRYVKATNTPRLAVVVSDDRTVDVIPVLRPRKKRSEIEENIAKLQSSNRDNYHPAINWLDRHRFYLDQGQCNQVNAVLERIRSETMEVGEIMIQWPEFLPNPGLDEEYFESEDAES
jgi:hypothetical protein